MAESNSSGGGIGLFGAVFIVFLVLKLVAVEPVASWSWWWVTSPLWGGLVFTLGLFALFASGIGVFSIFEGLSQSFGRRKRMKNIVDEGLR